MSAPIKFTAKARADSVLPLHHQVYHALYQKIIDSSFSRGDPMPGELRIAEDFHVSRTTVRRALDRLRREGLISRRRGAGTFAVSRVARDPGQPNMPYADYVGSASQAYGCEVLTFSFAPTPAFLDASPEGYGPVVLKVVRLSRAEALPVHLSVTYIPQALGQTIDRESLGSRPIVSILRNSGVAVERANLSIEAIAADSTQSELLQLPLGAPILRGLHVSFGKNDAPLEYNIVVSKPEHFRYRFVSDENAGVMKPVFGLG